MDMCSKIQNRPHTAFIKRPKTHFSPKGKAKKTLEDSMLKEVSGWE